MTSEQLNKLLIDNFPELKNKYYEETDWQDGDSTGSHVVYGDVFTPYIESVIDEKRYKELERIFIFIESILINNEDYSVEVIMFSVLEGLILNENFQICEKYLGPYTKNIIKLLLNYLKGSSL